MPGRVETSAQHWVPGDPGRPKANWTAETYRELHEVGMKEAEIKALFKAAADEGV